jgi:hypothetical protein
MNGKKNISRLCERCGTELNEHKFRHCTPCSNAINKEKSLQLQQKISRHRARVKKIKRGYGNQDWLIGDQPVRQREDILYEAIIPNSGKSNGKYSGNE